MVDKIVTVLIKRLPGNTDISIPEYHSEGAVGMDIQAAVRRDVVIVPGQIVSIPCGFCIAIPDGYEGQIRPRSGLAAKHGISIPNSPGTIDPDYRGEVKVLLLNNGSEAFHVKRGMRIAQMLVLPVPHVKWQEVDELPSTVRASGGFGHTGD
jgi:dUTP pyrophosphatase